MTSRRPMECHDVGDVADSFLGGDLSPEMDRQVRHHLETCLACREDLDARRTVRDGLRRAFQNRSELAPSPQFVAELRAKLQTAAREVPAQGGVRFHGWWALAATVLLAAAVGAAYLIRDGMNEVGLLARS